MAGQGRDQGTYYFGNTGTKYLSYDGTNFNLAGGGLFMGAGGGVFANTNVWTGYGSASGGIYYFGNTATKYLQYDGASSLNGGSTYCSGNVRIQPQRNGRGCCSSRWRVAAAGPQAADTFSFRQMAATNGH